jgi:hypothetical protein
MTIPDRNHTQVYTSESHINVEKSYLFIYLAFYLKMQEFAIQMQQNF